MKKKGYKICAILLTGIVFSLALTAMIISGSKSVNPFYNVGAVSEIRETVYRNDVSQEYGSQDSSGRFVLEGGRYELSFQALGNTNEWNYLCVWIQDLTTDTVHWDITYESADGSVISDVYSQDLTNGVNLVLADKNGFDMVRAQITGDKGTSFSVTNMQLRENPPVFTWGKATVIFLFAFAVYCCLAAVVRIILKKLNIHCNPYCWIDILQDIYILVAEQMRKAVAFIPQSGKIRNYCRTGLFLLIFLYSVYVEIAGTYYTGFKYHLFIYTVLLLVLAALTVESKLKKKNWNNPMVWSWLVLWLMVCISDFIVLKYLRFMGYVMIFGVGFLIFIWNNMKRPSKFTADFVRAVHWFFAVITVFCILCRPENDAYRYSGFTDNPSIFALYIGTCWAVVLGEIDSRIQAGEKLRKIIPYIGEGCLVFSFCWKSQSAGPLICMAGMAFLWLFKMVRRTRKKMTRKNLIAVIISAAVLILPVHAGLTWGLTNIPQAAGTAITYEGETTALRLNTIPVAYAAEADGSEQESRLAQKFSSPTLSRILSGRDYYYRTYLRDMNLSGHRAYPKMYGHRRLPHNAVIGIAHRYGVFAAVPYVLMLTAVIAGTIRYGRRKQKYSGVPFYICLSTIVVAMADNVEQPFIWLPWFGLYIMMGCTFTDNFAENAGYACRKTTRLKRRKIARRKRRKTARLKRHKNPVAKKCGGRYNYLGVPLKC